MLVLTDRTNVHLLKLVTGVDISTRPVRRSGNEGKAKNRSSLRDVAEAKSRAFRRSITMIAFAIDCLLPFSHYS